MFKSYFVLAALAAFASAPVMAQSATTQSTPKVSLSWLNPPSHPGASKAPAKGAGGDSLTLNVRIELAEGWHINSEAPLDSFLVPTSMDIKSEGMAFGKPRYPQPMIQRNKVMGDLSLYTGAFDVQVPAKRSGKRVSPPGRTSVTLHYQSCNNTMCLPPKSITVEQ